MDEHIEAALMQAGHQVEQLQAENTTMRRRVQELEAERDRLKRGMNLFAAVWLDAVERIKETEPDMFDFLYAPILERMARVLEKGGKKR